MAASVLTPIVLGRNTEPTRVIKPPTLRDFKDSEFYDLQKMRYKKSSSCGSIKEACEAKKSSGRIIPAAKQPGLLKPSKVYTRLVPE